MAVPVLYGSLLLLVSLYSVNALEVPNRDQHEDLQHRALPIGRPPQHNTQDSIVNTLGPPAVGDFLLDVLSETSTGSAATFTVDTTLGNALKIECDSKYGGNLNPSSCFSALDYCPTGSGVESWGDPELLPPGTAIDVALPVVKLGGS